MQCTVLSKAPKKKKNEEVRQADAIAEVTLHMKTQRNLCGSVSSFLRSLIEAAILLDTTHPEVHAQSQHLDEEEAHAHQDLGGEPPAHEQDLEYLKRFLAEADTMATNEGSPSPFGNLDQIEQTVQEVRSDGFTRLAAVELNLVIERWKGVQLGLGCEPPRMETKFLEKLWRDPSASSLLQKSQHKLINPLDWIAIGLFITVLHTDIFSVTDAFSAMGSARDVYGQFTRLNVENLQMLSCRLSYPMYLHTLRVKALERAFLGVSFSKANLKLPEIHAIDVCGKPDECQGYDMVCLSQHKCLRAIADMFPKGSPCSRYPADGNFPERPEACLQNFFNTDIRKVSHESEGLDCKIDNGKFYKFCGPDGEADGTITTIVPTQCFTWETMLPEGVDTGNHYYSAKPIAKYDKNKKCSDQFKALEDVTLLAGDFKRRLASCPFPVHP